MVTFIPVITEEESAAVTTTPWWEELWADGPSSLSPSSSPLLLSRSTVNFSSPGEPSIQAGTPKRIKRQSRATSIFLPPSLSTLCQAVQDAESSLAPSYHCQYSRLEVSSPYSSTRLPPLIRGTQHSSRTKPSQGEGSSVLYRSAGNEYSSPSSSIPLSGPSNYITSPNHASSSSGLCSGSELGASPPVLIAQSPFSSDVPANIDLQIEVHPNHEKWQEKYSRASRVFAYLQSKNPVRPAPVKLSIEEDTSLCFMAVTGIQYIRNVLRLRSLQLEGVGYRCELRLRSEGGRAVNFLPLVGASDGAVLGEIVGISASHVTPSECAALSATAVEENEIEGFLSFLQFCGRGSEGGYLEKTMRKRLRKWWAALPRGIRAYHSFLQQQQFRSNNSSQLENTEAEAEAFSMGEDPGAAFSAPRYLVQPAPIISSFLNFEICTRHEALLSTAQRRARRSPHLPYQHLYVSLFGPAPRVCQPDGGAMQLPHCHPTTPTSPKTPFDLYTRMLGPPLSVDHAPTLPLRKTHHRPQRRHLPSPLRLSHSSSSNCFVVAPGGDTASPTALLPSASYSSATERLALPLEVRESSPVLSPLDGLGYPQTSGFSALTQETEGDGDALLPQNFRNSETAIHPAAQESNSFSCTPRYGASSPEIYGWATYTSRSALDSFPS